MLSLQFENKNVLKLGDFYHIIAPYLNDLVNTITIVILIPFFNHVAWDRGYHVALPLFPLLSMSLKLRLAIGLIFNLIAILIAVILQATVQIDSNGSFCRLL